MLCEQGMADMIGGLPVEVDELDRSVGEAALETEVVLHDLSHGEVLALLRVRPNVRDRVAPSSICELHDCSVVRRRDRCRRCIRDVLDQLGFDGKYGRCPLQQHVEVRWLTSRDALDWTLA